MDYISYKKDKFSNIFCAREDIENYERSYVTIYDQFHVVKSI